MWPYYYITWYILHIACSKHAFDNEFNSSPCPQESSGLWDHIYNLLYICIQLYIVIHNYNINVATLSSTLCKKLICKVSVMPLGCPGNSESVCRQILPGSDVTNVLHVNVCLCVFASISTHCSQLSGCNTECSEANVFSFRCCLEFVKCVRRWLRWHFWFGKFCWGRQGFIRHTSSAVGKLVVFSSCRPFIVFEGSANGRDTYESQD